jgi:hypothetical protein
MVRVSVVKLLMDPGIVSERWQCFSPSCDGCVKTVKRKELTPQQRWGKLNQEETSMEDPMRHTTPLDIERQIEQAKAMVMTDDRWTDLRRSIDTMRAYNPDMLSLASVNASRVSALLVERDALKVERDALREACEAARRDYQRALEAAAINHEIPSTVREHEIRQLKITADRLDAVLGKKPHDGTESCQHRANSG